MLLERGAAERLGKDVGRVVSSRDAADVDDALSHVLAHAELAARDMARAVRNFALTSELDRTRVVDVELGGVRLVEAEEVAEDLAQVRNLCRGQRRGHNLCLGRGQGNALLPFARIRDGRTGEHDTVARRGVDY